MGTTMELRAEIQKLKTSRLRLLRGRMLREMDDLEHSENAKKSDSAYSNSCNNSRCRRSSKSTHSGSNSSGSSGYGGTPSTSGYGSMHSNLMKEKNMFMNRSYSKFKFELRPSELLKHKFMPPAPIEKLEVQKEEQKEEDQDLVVSKTLTASGSQAERGPENMEIACTDRASCNDENGSGMIQLIKSMNKDDNDSSFAESSGSFSCIISMHDGVVTYTSKAITDVLGYPNDMWIGRSFLDFVNQKDRNMFASQITSGLGVPKNRNGTLIADTDNVRTITTMVCRLKQYRTLSSGFGVKDRSPSFMPFLLRLSFKKTNDNDADAYLVIKATQYFSAYKKTYETISNAVPFTMRHGANGNVELIDPESVPYMGYMPQDLVDTSVMQLYHPQDLHYLQHIYETIVREGTAPRSRPYRLMIQNGDYIRVETEWSSSINAWSKKLECVIGKHYVIEGPRNVDVFQAPDYDRIFLMSGNDNSKTQYLRENILRIMDEVLTKPAELAKQRMTKRCNDLAEFMENLMGEQPKIDEKHARETKEADNIYYGHLNSSNDQRPEGNGDGYVKHRTNKGHASTTGFNLGVDEWQRICERPQECDTAVVAGISPHHDYSDNANKDTPITYNQLNHNETLQRYFESHEPFALDDSTSASSENIFEACEPTKTVWRKLSPTPMLSADYDEETQADVLPKPDNSMALERKYVTLKLTESLLQKHNAEMEKELMKQHREWRCAKSEMEKLLFESRQKKIEHMTRCNAAFVPTSATAVSPAMQNQGVKRGSKSVDTDGNSHKHLCTISRQSRRWKTGSAIKSSSVVTNNVATAWPTQQQSINSYIRGLEVPHPVSIVNPVNATPAGYYPMYYGHTAQTTMATHSIGLPPGHGHHYQHPNVSRMMYGNPMCGSPYMYVPAVAPNHPVQQDFITRNHQYATPYEQARRNNEEACKPSLPTDVKPLSDTRWREKQKSEMELKLAKITPDTKCNTSAGVSNMVIAKLPESAKEHKSPEKSTVNNNDADKTDGESSYSSFYSSFFKTESGSGDDSDAKKDSDVNKDSKKKATKRPYWNKQSESDDGIDCGTNRPYRAKREVHNSLKRKMDPPWMANVSMTPELIYKYQVVTKSKEEVLSEDLKKLQKMDQPPQVNEQLGQLYLDLQLQGVASRLNLDEVLTSSSSSSDEGPSKPQKRKYSSHRRRVNYSKMVMVHEEDAPLPPPEGSKRLLAPI